MIHNLKISNFEASKMEEFGRKNPTTSIITPVLLDNFEVTYKGL